MTNLADQDLMIADTVQFVIGRTYRTRHCFCKDGLMRHQSAKVIGQVNDHMGRLWLTVLYSDGHTGHVTPEGRTGLGYPHACDLGDEVL